MGKLNNEQEPVRLNGWTALVVGIGLLVALGWSLGAPVEAIVAQAVLVAMSSIGGLEFARKHATPEARAKARENLALRQPPQSPPEER